MLGEINVGFIVCILAEVNLQQLLSQKRILIDGHHADAGAIVGQGAFLQGFDFIGYNYSKAQMRKNVCELCSVFISRMPRSSRKSRDSENVLFRFLDFKLASATWCLVLRLRIAIGKSGVLLIIHRMCVFISLPGNELRQTTATCRFPGKSR